MILSFSEFIVLLLSVIKTYGNTGSNFFELIDDDEVTNDGGADDGGDGDDVQW